MRIEPVKGIKPSFQRGTNFREYVAPNTIHTRYCFSEKLPIPGGLLLREHPELPSGVGEKLDIIA